MQTVLFVGAGRHQRRAIQQARARRLRVVAVDRNPDARGLLAADAAEAVDFTDLDAVTEAAGRHAVDGVLTVSADRAVPVVAAVAERLGLPGHRHRDGTPDDAQDRDAPHARRGGRPAAPLRRRAPPRRGPSGARDRRPPRGAQAGRLGRPARRLPARAARRPRRPPPRRARRVGGGRGDRRVVRRRHRDERDRRSRAAARPPRHALGPASPDGVGFGVGGSTSIQPPSSATSWSSPSRSRSRPCTRSACATGSRFRS